MEDTLKQILAEIHALRAENTQLQTAVKELSVELKIARINILATEEMVDRLVNAKITLSSKMLLSQ